MRQSNPSKSINALTISTAGREAVQAAIFVQSWAASFPWRFTSISLHPSCCGIVRKSGGRAPSQGCAWLVVLTAILIVSLIPKKIRCECSAFRSVGQRGNAHPPRWSPPQKNQKWSGIVASWLVCWLLRLTSLNFRSQISYDWNWLNMYPGIPAWPRASL